MLLNLAVIRSICSRSAAATLRALALFVEALAAALAVAFEFLLLLTTAARALLRLILFLSSLSILRLYDKITV